MWLIPIEGVGGVGAAGLRRQRAMELVRLRKSSGTA